MKQYDVWVIAGKDNEAFPGGEIKQAYCTCTAGLIGSCNHVAGLLFRIEHAIITRAANMVACTSKLSTWNVPSGKKQTEPDGVCKFLFKQDSYMKRSVQKPTLFFKKINFQTMSNSQKEKLRNDDAIRKELFGEIKDIVPNCCFVEFIEPNRKKNKDSQVNILNLVEKAYNFVLLLNEPSIDI